MGFAGHTQHEMTSHSSMASIFQFLEEKKSQKEDGGEQS